ncbi:MAG: hypothetical protein ABL984_03850 [Pyrinomonadaceae bacterium]
MQKPEESLADFLNTIEPQAAAPPSQVSLRPTGEVEVLSPLALDQASAQTPNGLLLQRGAPRISWFHRSLIFGGGAAAAIVIIFLSALFIAVSEPSDIAAVDGIDNSGYPLDAEIDDSPAGVLPESTDIFTSAISPLVFGELRTLRPVVRSRRVLPRVQRAVYIPRRRSPKPAPVTEFVPTTLIIYAENGEIKTRIEPNLTAAFKIPPSFAN